MCRLQGNVGVMLPQKNISERAAVAWTWNTLCVQDVWEQARQGDSGKTSKGEGAKIFFFPFFPQQAEVPLKLQVV